MKGPIIVFGVVALIGSLFWIFLVLGVATTKSKDETSNTKWERIATCLIENDANAFAETNSELARQVKHCFLVDKIKRETNG